MDAARLVIPAAMVLVMASAFFGVVLARMVWADDLKHALRIDALRKQTEEHLRNTIESLERQLKLTQKR